jgi:hypothetical protein
LKKIILILLTLFSQQWLAQCDDPVVKKLQGVWVRDAHPNDTIKFGMRLGREESFELILADKPRPQSGPAGLYDFRTLGSTMLIHWLPSGSSHSEAITFYYSSDFKSISLENFYRRPSKDKLYTFKKLK